MENTFAEFEKTKLKLYSVSADLFSTAEKAIRKAIHKQGTNEIVLNSDEIISIDDDYGTTTDAKIVNVAVDGDGDVVVGMNLYGRGKGLFDYALNELSNEQIILLVDIVKDYLEKEEKPMVPALLIKRGCLTYDNLSETELDVIEDKIITWVDDADRTPMIGYSSFLISVKYMEEVREIVGKLNSNCSDKFWQIGDREMVDEFEDYRDGLVFCL